MIQIGGFSTLCIRVLTYDTCPRLGRQEPFVDSYIILIFPVQLAYLMPGMGVSVATGIGVPLGAGAVAATCPIA